MWLDIPSSPPAPANKIQYCKYIRLEDIPDWQALGWHVKPLPYPHSLYAVLGVWLCDCPMVRPL
jgi:hypothetical protein